jgi:[ribosomal protein S5]-alanine N-acetyltransferase
MHALTVGDITLEPLVVGHADAMYEVLKDPALYRFLDYEPPPSVDHLRTVYEKLQARRSSDGTQIWLNWVARLCDDELIGYVQATIEASGDAWTGVVFASVHRGKGHATRAAGAMIEHLEAAYAVKRFLATIEMDNEPSLRLFARLGFRPASGDEPRICALSPTECLLVRTRRTTSIRWTP